MTTRMVHPLHGATHAYDVSEIERLKGFGWEVEGEKSPVAEHIAIVKSAIAATAETAQLVEKRKPGRPARAK